MDQPQKEPIPNRLYRFRPLTVVKPSIVDGKLVPGKTVIEELEHQEIFVARLDELNDPMDGLHHTVWDGDSVIWQNFMRSYARCLLDAVCDVYIAGDTAPFDTGVIHTLKTPHDSPTGDYTALYEDLVRRVESNVELQDLFRALCRREKLHREELHALLSIHQVSFLREVSIALKAHMDMDLLSGLSDRPRTVDLGQLLEILPQLDDRVLSVTGEVGHRTNEQLYLIERYNSRKSYSIGRDNLMRLVSMFPFYYLKAAAEDIYGETYVASLSRSADDSSMWAHYAEQHRGICLIFEPGDAEEHRVIEMENKEKFALYAIDYRDDPAEINFFESLGKLSRSKIENGWIRLDGKASRLAAEYDDSYPARYWARFREKVSRKFLNWKYEDEIRLVRDTQFTGSLGPEDRILQYRFDHLVGIVFGMKTPVEVQVRIMEVIERKLGEHPGKDFKFFKAGYSASQSRFGVHELGLLKFKPEVGSEE